MNKTKKAEMAAADASGIRTANRPASVSYWDAVDDVIKNTHLLTASNAQVPAAIPADTGSESPVPSQENAQSDSFFWRKVTDDDVKAAIRGSFLETICDVLSKNHRGKPPSPMILGHAILLMTVTLTQQG